MIAFDLAYELTLGIACARFDAGRAVNRSSAERKSPQRGETFPKPGIEPGAAVRGGFFASAIVFIPISLIALIVWPAWQSMYLVDLDQGPLALACSIQIGGLLAAYGVGVRLGKVTVRARWLGPAIAIAWAGLLAFLFIGLEKRAFTVTSYADFYSPGCCTIEWGAPHALLGGSLMTFLIASGALNAAAFMAVLVHRRNAG